MNKELIITNGFKQSPVTVFEPRVLEVTMAKPAVTTGTPKRREVPETPSPIPERRPDPIPAETPDQPATPIEVPAIPANVPAPVGR